MDTILTIWDLKNWEFKIERDQARMDTILCLALSAVTRNDNDDVDDDEIDFDDDDDDACLSGEAGVDRVGWKGLLKKTLSLAPVYVCVCTSRNAVPES